MTRELKALDPPSRLLPRGEVVTNRFKLGEKIGEGPFGQVFRAEDTLIESEVAIKVFEQSVVDSPVDEEQFLKATRRARALTQKNVVRLHDSGIHDDYPWVSMQRLEGLDLRKVARLRWQRQEGFGLEEIEPILSQVTLALQHVGRDFPHGDLRPENIIFLPELIKVTDSFLVASLPDEVVADRLADNPFIAPEILAGEASNADVRCDVYSTGAIIGYMVFGVDYRPGSERDAPGALGAVDELCDRAMSDSPDERYASVEALHEDFTALVDTGSLMESSPQPVEVQPASQEATQPAAKAPPPGGDGGGAATAVATRDEQKTATSKGEAAPDTGEAVSSDADESGEAIELTEADLEDQQPRAAGADEAPRPDDDDDDGLPLGAIFAAAVLIAAFVGVVVLALGDQPEDADPPSDPEQDEAVAEAPPEPEEEPEEDDEEREEGDEELAEAIASAVSMPVEALEKAGEEAEQKAEELEEQQQPATGAATGRTGAAPAADCPSGMVQVRVGGNPVCVDAYQHPGAGRLPTVDVSWFEATSLCDEQGKRLCTIQEWRRACGHRYPYGNTFNPDRCNTADGDGFERSLAETGSFSHCRSPSGAYDMTGNAHEWVEEQRVVGGSYADGADVANCTYSSAMSPGASRENVGFRCCKTP